MLSGEYFKSNIAVFRVDADVLDFQPKIRVVKRVAFREVIWGRAALVKVLVVRDVVVVRVVRAWETLYAPVFLHVWRQVVRISHLVVGIRECLKRALLNVLF